MAYRIALICIVSLLAASCAQVGVLSGGPVDAAAPFPVEMNPTQNGLNYSGNSVSIEFDEYLKLNNPAQNIFIVPADAKIEAKLTKKTLELKWNETLQPNTTYVIYLNNAVQDLSEGNDSLMTYVFSTGNEIDSLKYSVYVNDAYTNEPLKGMLVGLFKNDTDKKPIYFARTDQQGEANLKNIKAGSYRVRSYKDEDLDLAMNTSELRGFRSQQIILDSSFIDSIPLRIYTPEIKKIKSLRFYSPGVFSLTAGFSLENTPLTFNGAEIPKDRLNMIEKDSLLFFAKTDTLSSIQLLVKRPELIDTVTLQITKKDKLTRAKLSVTNKGVFSPVDSIIFNYTDLITSLQPEKIYARSSKDSSQVVVKSAQFNQNKLTLEFEKTNAKNVLIVFPKGTIAGLNQPENDSLSIPIQLREEKEYGAIELTLWKNEHPLIVEVLNGNTVVKTIISSDTLPKKLSFLEPGDYRFRVIADQNSNGKWDAGDEEKNLQPELKYLFSTPTKVRANWEVEVGLEP